MSSSWLDLVVDPVLNRDGHSPRTQKPEHLAPIKLLNKLEGAPHPNVSLFNDTMGAASCVLQAMACLAEHCPTSSSVLDKAAPNSALSHMHSLLKKVRARYFQRELSSMVLQEDAAASLDILNDCIAWLVRLGCLQPASTSPPRCRVYWLCKEVLSEEMRTPMREVETNSLSELFTYAQSTAPNGQRHACNVRSSSNDEATFTLALGACAREDTIEKQPEFFANAGADEVANRN